MKPIEANQPWILGFYIVIGWLMLEVRHGSISCNGSVCLRGILWPIKFWRFQPKKEIAK